VPDQTENTAEQQQHEELPEKFRGKSAAEIARAYEELESKLGQMGAELGQLRAELSAREPSRPSEYVDRRWSELADTLLVEPEKAVARLAEELKREVLQEAYRVTSTQMSAREQLEAFFRANPDLDRFREIVSVIGERIYQANPRLPFSEVLRQTAEESRRYIASLQQRLADVKGAKRAAATTGGGGMARETAPSSSPEPPRAEAEDEVMAAIRELHEYRAKRRQPPPK
jgi:hypothetical protein